MNRPSLPAGKSIPRCLDVALAKPLLPALASSVYDCGMQSILRDVRDIEAEDRRSLEQILGCPLNDNQRILIQVLDRTEAPQTGHAEDLGEPPAQLPDWCRVYEGLSDDEIAEIESIVLKRADLSRSLD